MSLWREFARDLRRYMGLPVEYSAVEGGIVLGRYTMECFSPKGQRIWHAQVPNLLVTTGVNLMMEHTLQTAITIVGPFLGLIGGAGAPTIVNGDTMASHAGWLEAGLANPPTYSGGRKTTVGQWSAAAARSKALSAPQAYSMTGSGTVQGAFMVTGAGAVATVDSTAGTLFSAGAMTAQPVINGNTLSVSWSLTFT